jgi:hypothetical protein
VVSNVSVTAEVYENYVIDSVLPAIAKNAPLAMKSKRIFLQQDNASPHACINSDNKRFKAKCEELQIDVCPVFQPPNSPDLNILDLAFFNSLQTNCFMTSISNNKQELIDHVVDCYFDYPWETLERAYMTLQCVMNAILRCDGGNWYKLPHFGKSQKLRENGCLPCRLDADDYFEVVETDYDENDIADLGFEAQDYDDEIESLSGQKRKVKRKGKAKAKKRPRRQ